ncbi:winged helix-turn-helix transcriptional regulator [Halorientalis marina]|jgi:DNA-binding HxlR family transcriptional regulator|uniref:winged helix-turn-helix transcriptional regulator n=1 Tax=Halorientalis marina TaxID=2931976 RepID=UPI001FF557E9|nr:helix-turn-helix domain-containing protein [Halorientalis marina]
MSSDRTEALDGTDARGPSVPLFADIEDSLLSMQSVVGRKWHPVILYYLLADGPMGFSALKDSVDGISSKMLSEGLDDLESAGLVSRSLLSDRPVRVEYELTEKGRSLEGLVTEMVHWADTHDLRADGEADESDHETETDAPRPSAAYAEGE